MISWSEFCLKIFKLLIVAAPFPNTSGGGKRAFEILKVLPKFSCEATVVFPPVAMEYYLSQVQDPEKIQNELQKYIIDLERHGIIVDINSQNYLNFLYNQNSEKKLRKINVKLFFSKFSASIGTPLKIHWYLSKYPTISGEYDGIYAFHENFDSVLFTSIIAQKLKKPFCILLQLEPYNYPKELWSKYRIKNFREAINFFSELIFNITTLLCYKKMVRNKFFKGFMAVSPAPLEVSRLEHIRHTVLIPGNAFHKELVKFRKSYDKKSDYAVFFARISPEKGIFELPEIWKSVTMRQPLLHLFIIGKGEQRNIDLLKKLISQTNLEDKIKICGYISRYETLYSLISEAKVMVYPSHSDSFSLSLLESLAVGTPVVTYSIPAITSNYAGLSAVKIVKEGDIDAFIKECELFFNLSENEYNVLFSGEKIINFCNLHSSWENVALKEIESLKALFSLKIR